MILSPEEAEEGVCILRETGNNNDRFPGGPRGRCKEKNCVSCISSACIAYWRWADATHTKGYCAAGGKPEY